MPRDTGYVNPATGSVTSRPSSKIGTGSATGGGSFLDQFTNKVLADQRRLVAQREDAPFRQSQVQQQVGASSPRGMLSGASAPQTSAITTGGADQIGQGSVPGADAAAGDPLTGFASRFTPSGAELLQNEPAALLAETLRAMGINPSGGIYGMMEPLANDMNQLFQLFQGGQVGSLSDILNYGNQLFSDYATPGGQGVSYEGGLQNLFNASGSSPLGQFLGGGVGGDPQEQVRALMGLYGALVGNSVPLIQQGGLMNYANTAARDYIAQIARGDASSGNFANYLNARQPFSQY